MKKMLTNKKGFSLVELLIVIAIMGVLAAIAFSMFSGVFTNATKKADQRQGDNIAKALTAYIVDNNDGNLAKAKSVTTDGLPASPTDKDLILFLMQTHVIDGMDSGPYLSPRDGTVTASSANDYDPQWTKYVGYDIQIYKDTMMAVVKPVESGNGVTIN